MNLKLHFTLAFLALVTFSSSSSPADGKFISDEHNSVSELKENASSQNKNSSDKTVKLKRVAKKIVRY